MEQRSETRLRASSYDPVDRAASATGMNFALGSYENSEMRKGQRSWVRVLVPNLGKKANIAKDKNFNFRAYLSIGNS